jgi:hypothetical protein
MSRYLRNTTLERLGDLFRRGDLILPSTPRLIHVNGKDEYSFVAGGLPKSLLRSRFGVSASTSGLARFVRREYLTKSRRSNESIWQNALDWLGIWCRDLVGWTVNAIVQGLEQAHSGPPLGIEEIELLDIDVPGTRWRRLGAYRGATYGPRLCRSRDPGARGGYRYFLALLSVVEKEIQVEVSKELQRWDGVRLRFGVAALRGAYTEIAVRRTSTHLILKNPVALPMPENRVYALGTRSASEGSRELSFPIELEPLLSFVLDTLSIRLSR